MGNEELLRILGIAVKVIAGAALLYWLIADILLPMIYIRREDRQPTFTTGATVVGRTLNAEKGRLGTYTRDGGNMFYLVFHTEEGLELVLRVPRDDYYNTEDGARGELVWQGHRCWRFTQEG